MQRKGVAVFGEIAVDFDRMEIRRSGQIVHATTQEFRVLKFFIDNPEYVFTRQELLGAIWPERRRANGPTVDNCIFHLRQKVEQDRAKPAYLQTVHGAGYKFVPFGRREKAHRATWQRGLTADGRPEMRAPF